MCVNEKASEKEEFRGYLEKNGVVDALTKVLVGLYEEQERPGNGLEWVKQHLGATLGVDIEVRIIPRPFVTAVQLKQ